MAAHQHEPGVRPDEVASWASDTLDHGFGDGMGQAARMLAMAAMMLMSDQESGRRVKLEGEDLFWDDSMTAPPVIGL
jgi:hypothetical protein